MAALAAASGQPGAEIWALAAELYPLCRSITGDGVRQTLRILEREIPLVIHEVPTGTQVFDWTVPNEWNIRDAYIQTVGGQRVVDFQESNLHVVSYSMAVKQRIGRDELAAHVHTLPERPDWIPYKTSYYNETWGFCLTHNRWLEMRDPEYDVCIDSTVGPGHLTYGECYLAGESSEEILVSTHVCHPSLSNDNLSGIAVSAFLARAIQKRSRRYSYRFLFVPGTIGAITWLALNRTVTERIRAGVVLACVGNAGPIAYKKSRRGDAAIDRAFAHVLKHGGDEHEIVDFNPGGYDERQYCSPGFNLPVGCLTRSARGYRENHTSADNPAFLRPAALEDTWTKALAAFEILEANRRYRNLCPNGEPQLGRRGLYRLTGGLAEKTVQEDAIRWVLNFSDGEHSLLDIAEMAGIEFAVVDGAARALVACDLLEETRA